ncbi:CASP-like protein [Apostasia shenzhenica]|uniref:CASP-like protein n=1 Tax=Apostasia shenzhenica TaxID=1088818 RepID=A0A2I0BHI0_9ASPA|nr:CASP-like protein [Apostasia shenzhenica]
MAAAADGDGKPRPYPAADAEDPRPQAETAGDAAVTSVVRRWKREDILEKGVLLLRALGWVFSLISLVVMASNKHGDWMNFDRYEEYRYLLAISILAFLYSMGQVVRQVHRFSTGRDVVPARAAAIVDFAGDQTAAYLLMSALSAAIPLTNNMRKGADNLFTDASSAAISMAFFAFLSLALSALISGYKLSKQTHI